ncbi:MAG: RluA family pseudouridine synthase [Candidatus Saganbacteria bacterium]|nr:RluA family pseudouridine synthase [Candidatus Saganbacteria bacterium]
MEFSIIEQEKGLRLDQFLVSKADLTRSRIKNLIESGNILVNNKLSKPGYKIRPEDNISVSIPEPQKMTLKPEEIPLCILYEDRDIVVINKARGLTVHPGAGRHSGTLVNALLHHCKDLSGIGGVERPGIVHRLDKDTSGVLVVAKNDKAHQNLSKQFKNREVEKTYLALVEGKVKKDVGTICERIGRHTVNRKKMAVVTVEGKMSREAVTHYKVLKRLERRTLLELKIETGRTHQIRVHLKYIGYPVVGDPLYGKGKAQLLHAYKIKFTHPVTGKEMEFEAALPKDMLKLI